MFVKITIINPVIYCVFSIIVRWKVERDKWKFRKEHQNEPDDKEKREDLINREDSNIDNSNEMLEELMESSEESSTTFPNAAIKINTSTFKDVNRDQEDLLVQKYQKSNDPEILDKLYELRKQTLAIWSKKYSYLGFSEEDMMSEVSMIWLKCVNQYQYDPKSRVVRTKDGKFVVSKNGKVKKIFKRTPFNTFLYTSLRNYMSNISKRKYSKKRVDKNGKPLESNMISLDSDISHIFGTGSSKPLQLKDVLPSDAPATYSKQW